MRRYVVSIAVLLMVITAAGTASAQEEKEKGKGKSKSPLLVQPKGRKTPEELGRRKRVGGAAEAGAKHRREREGMARGMLHREQLRKLDKQLEQQRGEFERFVGELKAIKELALQEKAAKTAERLQRLIDIRTGLFNEDVRKLETRRDDIRKQVEKQAEGRLRRKELLMQREKEQREKEQQEKDKGKDKGQGKDKSEAKP